MKNLFKKSVGDAATSAEQKRSDKEGLKIKVHPFINFQLGLIVVLLLTLILVELNSPLQDTPVVSVQSERDYYENAYEHREHEIIPNEPKTVEKQPQKKIEKKLPIVVDKSKAPEITKEDPKPIEKEKSEPVSKNTTDDTDTATPVKTKGTLSKTSTTNVPITRNLLAVDEVPLFPGCEGLKTNDERRDCLNKSMQAFVQRRFDTNQANKLNLEEGINKIDIIFVINERGEVDKLQIRAPHPELKKEAQRVIAKLPIFRPGMVNGNPVNVSFYLPISFKVGD